MSNRKEVIEVEEITEVRATYTYGGGKSTKVSEEVVEVIDIKHMEDFKKWIDKGIKLSPFKEGFKVIFHNRVKFPKRKFAQKFPTCKIVSDPNIADMFIIDKDALESQFRWFWTDVLYQCEGNKWTMNDNYAGKKALQRKVYKRDNLEKIVKTINTCYQMENKMIVDIQDLSLPSDEVLDVEAFERISKMFESTDDNMRNMAMRLLTAYDYSKEKERIAVLLNLNWRQWLGGNRKTNVEIDSMLRKLNLDYSDYCTTHYYGGIPFPLKMVAMHPEDEVLTKALNIWIKESHPDNKDFPDIKLVKI